MSPGLFWGSTPREYDAFRNQWEDSRRFQQSLYAGLQATLHNGLHFKPPNGLKSFTPAMWMPGYVAPVETADRRLQAVKLRHAFSQQMTPEQRELMQQQHIDSQHRHERARKAREAGATRQECILIMEGKA